MGFEIVRKSHRDETASERQMRLLTWNPSKWEWSSRQEDISRCHQHGWLDMGWSCGGSKIPIGSRVFLMRLGEPPKGLVGSGEVIKATYESPHWDPQKAADGENCSFVGVRFDFLADAPPINEETLNQPPFNIMGWTPQNSGNHISERCRADLESLWSRVTGAGAAGNPDEIEPTGSFIEGASKTVCVNRYERDQNARRRCIDIYGGPICFICGLDFADRYGEFARGYIHVHHKKQLAEIREEYEVDPGSDLCPLCPNCHAAIHLTDPLMNPEELRAIWLSRSLKDATEIN